jgi:preprotein translocase subunit SecG
MYWFLIVLHVFVCAFLVLVVLLQAGKGGGVGIAFGGGGSQTVFGSSGAGNFLTKMTAICATIFFLNSLALAYLSSQSDSRRLQRIADQQAASAKASQEAKAKVVKDIEKAREELQKKGGAAAPPASSSTTEPAAPGTSAPAAPGTSAPAAPGTSAPAATPPASAPPAPSTPPASSTPPAPAKTP